MANPDLITAKVVRISFVKEDETEIRKVLADKGFDVVSEILVGDDLIVMDIYKRPPEDDHPS